MCADNGSMIPSYESLAAAIRASDVVQTTLMFVGIWMDQDEHFSWVLLGKPYSTDTLAAVDPPPRVEYRWIK